MEEDVDHAQQMPPASAVASANLNPTGPPSDRVPLERSLFLVLSIVALAYAFLAGLRTVSDPDLFWQLATGRWVAQHHHTFSTDVFSYSAAQQPWIYPAGSGLLLYAAYLLGGYSLLSWIGAAASCGTVALLLRRGNAVTAGIAIIALPLIASRTAPRAEMFTVILFAAYLSILWENHQTGRARLWLLSLLMLAWVNLHLGFLAGLAAIVGFIGLEFLEMVFGSVRRRNAVESLRRSWPWFAAAGLATLANPWGWGIYQAIARQDHAMAQHSAWIAEWGSVPLNWTAIAKSFSLRDLPTFYLLLVIVAVTAMSALLRRQPGLAILLAGAAYPGVRHVRMEALSACVVIVLGSSILHSLICDLGLRLCNPRARTMLATSAAVLLAALAVQRSVEAVKIHDTALSTFGAGLSWWLPERAAQFIERENVPGEVFNTYMQGGYLAWRLGPERRNYIDGRAIPFGPRAFLRQAELLQSSLDSPLWQTEADRFHINAILLPVDRFQPVLGELKSFCNSVQWQPIYLDEVSAVFVRRRPETEDPIKRLHVDCATAPLPARPAEDSAATRFNQWANAAGILAALGRNTEALSASEKARELDPDSSFVPWVRGNIFFVMGLRSDAEREYLAAISAEPNVPRFWFSLATLYQHEGRTPETIRAQRQGIELSTLPQPMELLKLARLYLDTHQPKAALETFDKAARGASPDILAATGEHNFQFEVDQGRAEAWRELGDRKQAAVFDQKAVQDLVPQQ